MASELKIKIVELEARAEAAEMKLKTAQVGMRKAQQELEEAQATIKKNEDRVNQAETRAGENERKGRNLLQRVHELEGQLETIKKDKSKFELQAEEVRAFFFLRYQD
jgi:chromosome segregation ATPase